MANKDAEHVSSSKFQKTGLLLALIFYLVSIIMVFRVNNGGEILDKDVKTITFAHWQLEDGFREGFDKAIKLFEQYKAKQGQKVKVIQTTVPFMGYQQWFMTQLVGGDPADLVELVGNSSDIINQYFTPLSQYIGNPNPFNKDTPLAGIPWKDTYVDGMNNSLDWSYAEYYGIGLFIHTFRLFVNMDLLQKSTGSRKLPQTLTEWMDICKKMQEYGKKLGKPVIPIGVRGFGRGTIGEFVIYYQTQLNSDLNDTLPEFCGDTSFGELFKAAQEGKIPGEKQLAAFNIVAEIGKYFCEGFPATDLEQTKYLFFAGKVGFFPEGTWNAFSMINNSPFEVEIMEVPVIGNDHKYSKYFCGRPSDKGVVSGLFGIPKATKNFDLTLEFLQFITSWKINQMTMVEHSKWLAAVKKVNYSGVMKKMAPYTGASRGFIEFPFAFGNKNYKDMLEATEAVVLNTPRDPQQFFLKEFVSRIPEIRDEMSEVIETEKRNMINIETMRCASAFGLEQRALSEHNINRLKKMSQMNFENLTSRYKNARDNIMIYDTLEKFKLGDKKNGS